MNAATLRRALRVIIAAAGGLAIAVPVTVAAPSAQAAGTLTGPSSAGVSQSVTVTLSSAYEGLVNLIDIANNQQVSSASAGLGAQDLSFVFTTPSAPTTMVLSAIQNGKPLSSNNLTLTVGSKASPRNNPQPGTPAFEAKEARKKEKA